MARLTLTLACTASDRTRPILDGRVSIPGVELIPLPGEPEDIFRRALRDRAFAISELSMGSHIVTTARGDAPYVGLPVFPSRAFRHSAVYIRTDRGIRGPKDLEGKLVAVPEFQQTAALWVRGILREHYGVDTRAIRWRSAGERVAIAPPPGHDLAPLGEAPEVALAAGRVDALIAPRIPAGLGQGVIARLWPDYAIEERAWHARTGFFPIMHCIALRRDLAEAHPWLPVEIYRAFARARAIALEELSLINVLRISLPWGPAAFAEQAAAMGGDPWPIGFARNREELSAMIRFAASDGLIAAPFAPEELFHPSVLAEG
ncbi:MAG: ABC transporter substrate-binding protein [Rhodovarius sp.]|nr:ABC transporter substrate-binding protein [Rhodovarius sp.]